MATVTYSGNAYKAAQIDTATPANVEVSDVFTLTLTDHLGNTDTISYTATAATVQDVVEGLDALVTTRSASATGAPPWSVLSSSEDDSVLTLTASTTGVPFTLTAAESDGGGTDDQTHTRAASVACSGPGILSLADNWQAGSTWSAGDDVVLPAGVADTIYGEDLTSTAPDTLTVESGFAGDIGAINSPLQLDFSGQSTKLLSYAGSGQSFLDVDNAAEILVTGGRSDSGSYPGLHIVGLDNTKVTVRPTSSNTTIGLASTPGTTFESDDIYIHGGTVTVGAGVTETDGATAPDLYVYGGTVYVHCDIGKIYAYGNATVIADPDESITITNVDASPGAKLRIGSAVTLTNPVALVSGANQITAAKVS
jgi:hypothetical protein